MSEDFKNCVHIGVGSSYVRLSRGDKQRGSYGMTTAEIEVKGGPFTGVVRDDTLVGVAKFCTDLQTLYERLTGRAELSSYEKFKLILVGDGRGGIQALVELYGAHMPLSKLAFEMEIDQTFLPNIIRGLRSEFLEE